MKKNVVIIGAGKFAETVHYCMMQSGEFEVVAFAVQPEYRSATSLCNLPVVDLNRLPVDFPPSDYRLFSAIGPQNTNANRINIYNKQKTFGYQFATFLDPHARIWPNLVVGENVYIDDSSIVQPFVRIGDNVTLISAGVGHHSRIGDHCFLSSTSLGGNVTVEEGAFLGMNSVVRDWVTVGSFCVVGMSATVQRGLDSHTLLAPPKGKAVSVKRHRMRIITENDLG